MSLPPIYLYVYLLLFWVIFSCGCLTSLLPSTWCGTLGPLYLAVLGQGLSEWERAEKEPQVLQQVPLRWVKTNQEVILSVIWSAVSTSMVIQTRSSPLSQQKKKKRHKPGNGLGLYGSTKKLFELWVQKQTCRLQTWQHKCRNCFSC